MIVRKSGKICLTERDPSMKTFLDGIGTILQTENKKRIIRTFFNVRIIPLWWEEVDLNHRSRRRQIYSLIHLAALESSRIYKVLRIVGGAGDRN